MSFDLAAALFTMKRRIATADGGRAKKILIVTHDNPDPDSIAAALGLKFLFDHEAMQTTTTIAFGGIIGRAENRAMIRELKVDLRRIDQLSLDAFGTIALVDTQPGTGNNSLPADARVDIVVDHHPPRPGSDPVVWRDVRADFGATASIVYGYLKERGLPPDANLATALLYAVKSETRDLGREAGEPERAAYVELSTVANFSLLHAMTHPKLSREHFAAVDRAIRSAICWGDLLTVNLGTMAFPDLVAEVADLLLPYEKAHWVLCVGEHRGSAFISVRTDIETAAAGALIRKVVGAKGASGGHGMIAGGRLFAEIRDDNELKSVYDELVAGFVSELKIAARPTPLL